MRTVPTRPDVVEAQRAGRVMNAHRKSLDEPSPGDVLVIDARGDARAATLGDILAARIMRRGAAGIVTDGAFRDTPSIRELDLATYAQGQSPYVSTRIHHPQDINVPIGCGGVAVLPGDLVVGDGEGVVVIPRALAEEVVQAAFEQDEREKYIMSRIQAGSSILGVYPPDADTLREYEAWKQQQH